MLNNKYYYINIHIYLYRFIITGKVSINKTFPFKQQNTF